MKKGKMIVIVLLVFLIGFVLLVYDQFNGNPITKYMAMKELQSYLKENYPDKELRIESGNYNFKFQSYSFQVVEIGGTSSDGMEPRKYSFSVRGYLPKVYQDGIYDANLDQELMEKIGKEAEEEIQALLAKDVKTLHSVYVYVEFLKGTFPPDTHWNKSMKFEKPIGIHIYLNATHATKEQIFEEARKIQAILNQKGYDYGRVNINANVMDDSQLSDKKEGLGYVKYAISFAKDEELNVKKMREFNR